MWTCPNCERVFKSVNQSHYCGEVTLDDIFAKSPDHLLLAFDAILQQVMMWEPCTVGAARKSVVFANTTAWLIVKPMAKQLDVKFYTDSPIDHARVKRIAEYRGKFAHHLRIAHEDEVNTEVLELLKEGYDFAMRS